MADGSAKAISKIKVGDKVLASVPGGHTETHKVERVIVTRTDHDFVDLTIATSHPGRGPPATLTTTATHPFYDITQSAFVDAAHIKQGDKLQQPDGTTATVKKTHRYTATQVTYDLTINGLHTYYVEAGTTPVLVHNCNGAGGATDLEMSWVARAVANGERSWDSITWYKSNGDGFDAFSLPEPDWGLSFTRNIGRKGEAAAARPRGFINDDDPYCSCGG
ncbi:polymorphic toxin-type HINT domain-containing protein [Actinomadura bangladeshensis]|uniref:polymorphic toxin-type HINT domain-containing protein n=1 Tax=Actinomadura bangladeshensis TaxID=453573 RepID=UPI001404E014|nr:polymorphic toxin-type HINT domain-containing protein [Actinomadura bangladeshensis]